jgi:predicted XRE-type DNA-binding protein
MSGMTSETHQVTDSAGDSMGYTVGSDNIFADLSIAEPEAHLAKAELVGRIADVLAGRGLTQRQAAEILGVTQPNVSALLRGDFTGFSLERLFRLLILLGNDIAIVVEPKSREHGRLSVVAR